MSEFDPDEFLAGTALVDIRTNYADELSNPQITGQLFSLTHREVGGQGRDAQRAFVETLFNRAAARNMTLAQTISDPNYFPAASLRPAALKEDEAKNYMDLTDEVLGGSNVSNLATGNASGRVGFAGGPQTYEAGGERFGVEGPDVNWASAVKGTPVDLQEIRVEKAKPVKIEEMQVARAIPVEQSPNSTPPSDSSFDPDEFLAAKPEAFDPDEFLGTKEKKSDHPELERFIPQGLSPEEEKQAMIDLGKQHPIFEGIGTGLQKLVPKTAGEWGQLAKSTFTPWAEAPKAWDEAQQLIRGKSIEEVIPQSQELKKLEDIKKQYGGGSPEYQKAAGEAAATFIPQILMAAGIAKGLRPDVAAVEAAAGIKEAAKEAIPDAVKPVEAPEAVAPAPEARAFTEPTVARPQPPQTADITRTILDRRNELIAEAQELGQQAQISQKMGMRPHPAVEARMAEINSELNNPTIGAINPLEDSGPSVMLPDEQTGRVAASSVSTTPGDIAVGQQQARQGEGVGIRPEVAEPRFTERFDPDEFLENTVDPRTGISNKAFQAVYGKGEIPSATGKGPAAWKQLGDERLAKGDDPYAAIAKAKQAGIMPPEDLALVRSEHKKLLAEVRASEGTPFYEEKARFAADMADAIQQNAKGPASDVFRGLQEWDEPTFDNFTDFDQIVRKRLNRELDATEQATYRRIANDVKNTRDTANIEADRTIDRVRSYRPKEQVSFEDATKDLHDQITKLTADCIL